MPNNSPTSTEPTEVGRAPSGQALAVPATPANAVDGPSGFDPSRLVAVEYAMTKAGRTSKKPWVVTYRGKIVCRHRWQDNAHYRAGQLVDALRRGFVPAGDA